MATTALQRRTAAGSLVLALSLAACTPGEPEPTTPTAAMTSSSPASTTPTTPTKDPDLAAAESAVLEAYRGYWAAKVASYADPTQPQDPNLAVYADDTALTDAQSTIFTLRDGGIAIPGEPVLDPVVSDIVLGDARTAVITDCVDSTNWQPIYVATNESAAAPGQAMRVVAESTAFVAEGQWRIRTFVIQRDRTC